MITFMIRTRNVQNKLLNSISFKWKLLIKLTDNKLAKMFRQDAALRNVLLQCSLKSAIHYEKKNTILVSFGFN